MRYRKMVDKLQVLGREITLPTTIETEELTRERVLSILRDVDSELASMLESGEFTIRIEQGIAIVYRDSAVMG